MKDFKEFAKRLVEELNKKGFEASFNGWKDCMLVEPVDEESYFGDDRRDFSSARSLARLEDNGNGKDVDVAVYEGFSIKTNVGLDELSEMLDDTDERAVFAVDLGNGTCRIINPHNRIACYSFGKKYWEIDSKIGIDNISKTDDGIKISFKYRKYEFLPDDFKLINNETGKVYDYVEDEEDYEEKWDKAVTSKISYTDFLLLSDIVNEWEIG